MGAGLRRRQKTGKEGRVTRRQSDRVTREVGETRERCRGHKVGVNKACDWRRRTGILLEEGQPCLEEYGTATSFTRLPCSLPRNHHSGSAGSRVLAPVRSRVPSTTKKRGELFQYHALGEKPFRVPIGREICHRKKGNFCKELPCL